MNICFDSPEAATINRDIFETIYYGALKASHELAVRDGPYSSFQGSPASKGILQFDMWNNPEFPVKTSGRHDWESLKTLIKKDGIRNSLLIAPMPTASTAQILGNTECFEPVAANYYVKRVLAGEFTIVNKHLQRDLIKLGLWNDSVRQRLLRSRGSLQDPKIFSDIPIHIRDQYKTASEIKQKVLINMAADRGAFIDQSQSLNIFVKSPTDSILTNIHLYAWKRGLKTGMYYLRRDTVAKPQQFTSAPRNFSERVSENQQTKPVIPSVTKSSDDLVPMCRRDNPDCEACGS
jgi:ribonucleoside-diphosphate reductase alpha chain